ncbi:MAG: cell division protein FtsA [Caedimonas sp.]|jgi:cell division protein FtsA|nr:cell division protein FtsA [Caedimonas sp.]
MMKLFNMRRRLTNPPSGLIAGLDIGSSKVSCAIARLGSSGVPEITGFGHQASRGLRNGAIVDMEALTTSVAAAVHTAEEMADETISEVFVCISPAITTSHPVGIEAAVSGHPIDEADVRKMVSQACQGLEQPGQHVIHAIPVSYEVDGSRGIRDPRGMFGDRLGANIYIITANSGPLRNFAACIERCHLEVAGFIVSGYASGLATLVDDELELGVTLIDMGAGCTSISVFYDGKLHHTDYVNVGGAHITGDVARGFSTPMIHAERLKTLYGSAMLSSNNEREKILVPQIGEDENHKGSQITRVELYRVIRPRVEETFELVRERLKECDVDKVAGKRLVLTGGASQLSGILDMANLILDKQGRLGKPVKISNLTQNSRMPEFASTMGLILYGQNEYKRLGMSQTRATKEPLLFFERIGGWLRENL